MLDTMSERYGKLPSEVIKNASTFDLFICNTAMSYRAAKNEESSTGSRPAPKLSQQQLLQMMEGVKKYESEI
jgi:hypothetical protein